MAFFSLLLAGLLFFVAAAGGIRLIRALLPDSREDEQRVLGFPLAMAILSIVTTIFLFARIPVKWGLGAIIIVAWVVTRAERKRMISEAWSQVRSFRTLSGGGKLYVAVVVAVALLGIIGCLAPETGWDTGVYHFTMARLRAESGEMVVRDDIPHGYRPGTLESLFTVGFVLSGETLASLMNFGLYFSGLGFARLWAGRLGGARARLLGGFAYLTSTTYVLRMGGGDVEVGQAVYLTMAMYALWKLREGADGRWRVLVGIGLGMMLGIKYASAWAIIAVAVTWLVLRLKDRAGIRALAMDALVIGALCAVIASPWYIRNIVVKGSALYPFEVAGGMAGDTTVREGTFREIFKTLALDGFILAAVAGLLIPSLRRSLWIAAVSVLFFVLVLRQMGLTPHSITNAFRYSSPGFLGLLILGALGVDEALRRGVPLRIFATLCLAGPLLLAVGIHGWRNVRKVPAAIGLESREEYLGRKLDFIWTLRRAEGQLLPGRKLLLVEERAYYCRVPVVVAHDFQTQVRWEDIQTWQQLRAFLDIHSIGVIAVTPPQFAKTWKFDGWLKRHSGMLEQAGVRFVDQKAVTVGGEQFKFKVYRVE